MLSDEAFIKQRLDTYPDWLERPGQAGLERLLEIAAELGVGFGAHVLTGYDEALAEHEDGHPILIRYQREGTPSEESRTERIGLLAHMDKTGLRLWVPEADGSSDTVTVLRYEFWDRTGAAAIVFNGSPSLIPSLR